MQDEERVVGSRSRSRESSSRVVVDAEKRRLKESSAVRLGGLELRGVHGRDDGQLAGGLLQRLLLEGQKRGSLSPSTSSSSLLLLLCFSLPSSCSQRPSSTSSTAAATASSGEITCTSSSPQGAPALLKSGIKRGSLSLRKTPPRGRKTSAL